MEGRTIPAFYCCYLLRSKPPKRTVYVGSTPNPRRRLQQHNTSGGAKRTRSKEHRPWTMDCIVTGFPSKLAALQFEWAWQNPHLTKRIPSEDRITLPRLKRSPKSPKSPKRQQNPKKNRHPVRPPLNLRDRLQNLHLLIRVPSFSRWPLKVRFFNAEVWQEWHDSTKNMKKSAQPGVDAVLDLKITGDVAEASEKNLNNYEKGKRRRNAIGKGGVEGLDVGYTSILAHLEKSESLLGGDNVSACAVCDEPIFRSLHMSVVCPHEKCDAASHMTCLAKRFLSIEKSSLPILPISGHCPKCKTGTQWIDLIKEMTLRARGKEEVAQLMKNPGMKKIRAKIEGDPVALEAQMNDNDEEADEVPDEPLADDWLPQEDDDEDLMSVASGKSPPSTPTKASTHPLPTVIEDSEWDDAAELS